MNQNRVPEKPFFARLLEAQQLEQVKTDLKVGRIERTTKYPSDNDEWPWL